MRPREEKQDGSENSGCRVSEQGCAIAEGDNTDPTDRGCTGLAESSGEILYCRSGTSLCFRNAVHEQVVDSRPTHELHCEIENIEDHCKGSGSGGGDQQQEDGSADLNDCNSSGDAHAPEEHRRNKHGAALSQLGNGENYADPAERNGKDLLKVDRAK